MKEAVERQLVVFTRGVVDRIEKRELDGRKASRAPLVSDASRAGNPRNHSKRTG